MVSFSIWNPTPFSIFHCSNPFFIKLGQFTFSYSLTHLFLVQKPFFTNSICCFLQMTCAVSFQSISESQILLPDVLLLRLPSWLALQKHSGSRCTIHQGTIVTLTYPVVFIRSLLKWSPPPWLLSQSLWHIPTWLLLALYYIQTYAPFKLQ